MTAPERLVRSEVLGQLFGDMEVSDREGSGVSEDGCGRPLDEST